MASRVKDLERQVGTLTSRNSSLAFELQTAQGAGAELLNANETIAYLRDLIEVGELALHIYIYAVWASCQHNSVLCISFRAVGKCPKCFPLVDVRIESLHPAHNSPATPSPFKNIQNLGYSTGTLPGGAVQHKMATITR